jgi:hypothetical protein
VLDFTAMALGAADVTMADNGSDTVVSVNLDGTMFDVVTLSGVTGLDVADMMTDSLLLL